MLSLKINKEDINRGVDDKVPLIWDTQRRESIHKNFLSLIASLWFISEMQYQYVREMQGKWKDWGQRQGVKVLREDKKGLNKNVMRSWETEIMRCNDYNDKQKDTQESDLKR